MLIYSKIFFSEFAEFGILPTSKDEEEAKKIYKEILEVMLFTIVLFIHLEIVKDLTMKILT